MSPQKTTYVFVSFRPLYKHGVSIHSLINLSTTFIRISPARNIAQTWISARLFQYSSSLASLIQEFIFWMVLMMMRQWKPAILLTADNLHSTRKYTTFLIHDDDNSTVTSTSSSWWNCRRFRYALSFFSFWRFAKQAKLAGKRLYVHARSIMDRKSIWCR